MIMTTVVEPRNWAARWCVFWCSHTKHAAKYRLLPYRWRSALNTQLKVQSSDSMKYESMKPVFPGGSKPPIFSVALTKFIHKTEWNSMLIYTGNTVDLVGRYSDLLRAGWSGDPIPERARFSAPLLTAPGAHSTSCTTGTGSLSRG